MKTIESQKIDFASILSRRKRTIKNFINEYKIITLNDLNNVISNLEQQFYISDDFRKTVIESLETSKTLSKIDVQTLGETTQLPVEPSDEVLQKSEDQKPAPKRKKVTNKPTKD